MEWPDHFPEICPPDDSIPASGEVYRCINNPPPKRTDFLSLFEEGRRMWPGTDKCMFCGLSIYSDVEDIFQMWRRVKGFGKRHIVKGRLDTLMGKMKNTPIHESSHYTWWIPVGCEPWKVFESIEVPE